MQSIMGNECAQCYDALLTFGPAVFILLIVSIVVFLIRMRGESMNDKEKLVLLRMQLFTAAQTLTGDDADTFWQLIDDIKNIEMIYRNHKEQP